MTWPVNNITTTYLSSNSATILGARPEIYTVATSVSDIIDSRGQASGVASLDVSGMIPITELPPTHRTYGGIHLTLDSSSGKVILKDFIHLTPYTQAQLDAKINNTVGDLAIGSDVDGGDPGISIWDGSIWKCASTTNIGPKVGFYDPDITSSSPVFFTIPTNITRLKITAVGAGGGGGSAVSADGSTAAIGGTGGAGSTVIAWIDNLVSGDTVEVYCGIGGAAGIAGEDDGTEDGQVGEDTTVVITRADSTVQTITAAGGNGGVWSDAGAGANGTGGQGAVTNINANKHIIIDGNSGTSVMSGASQYGPYVVANTTAATGGNATQYGSGGGNGYDLDTTGFNGGYGANGFVSIEY
jgi:hypothetical protein